MVKDFEIEWNWYLTLQSLHWHYATIRLLGLSLSHSQQWVGPQWATKRILLIDFTAGPACFSHPFPWTFQFTRRHLRIWLLGITWNMKQIEAISFGDQPFTALQICWFCCPPVGAQTKEGGTWSSAISCNLSMRSAVYTCTDRHKICKYALFEKQYVYNMLHIRIYKYNTDMFDHRRTQVFLQVLGLRSLGLPSFLPAFRRHHPWAWSAHFPQQS